MKQHTLAACALALLAVAAGANGLSCETLPAAVAANTDFALDLLNEAGREPGNLFFSPLSISLALGMTYEGARGRTAEQMAAVLHLDPEAGSPGAGVARLLADLPLAGEGEGCQLSLANRLWGERSIAFRSEFLATNREAYGASLQQLDFAGEPEQARRRINAWVAGETRDKIKELLQVGDIDPSSLLVLTNAIHFYGPWQLAFSPERTRPAPFHLSDTESVEVPTMIRQGRFLHASLPEVELLQLPYTGGNLAMAILLPAERNQLATLQSQLDRQLLDEWLGRLSPEDLTVALPRFQLETRCELSDVLARMGMPDAFGGRADFSGMTSEAKIWIDKVIHQAWIEVNEEGTEAAAATAVTMKRAAYQPIHAFRADRPFLFLIRDLETGTILFLGRVADPRGGTGRVEQ